MSKKQEFIQPYIRVSSDTHGFPIHEELRFMPRRGRDELVETGITPGVPTRAYVEAGFIDLSYLLQGAAIISAYNRTRKHDDT